MPFACENKGMDGRPSPTMTGAREYRWVNDNVGRYCSREHIPAIFAPLTKRRWPEHARPSRMGCGRQG